MSSRATRRVGLKVSAFLVRGVLVDTGFPRLVDEVRQVLDPARMRGAIVTHYHEDHAGNVDLLASLGIPVRMSGETRRLVADPARVGLYRHFTWGPPRRVVRLPDDLVVDDLDFVPTPGHSADHHVVWDPSDGSLFGGDLFLGVKVRVAHHHEDVRGTMDSLRRVIALEPARLFDAHRGMVAAPTDLLRAKLQWMSDTVGAIEARHHAGASEGAILREVLQGEELIGWLSAGDYSRRNFVHAVLASMPRP